MAEKLECESEGVNIFGMPVKYVERKGGYLFLGFWGGKVDVVSLRLAKISFTKSDTLICMARLGHHIMLGRVGGQNAWVMY